MPIKKIRKLRVPDERRLCNRLPITQPVRYKERRGNQMGSGNTLNMSSRGVLFTTDRSLTEGMRIELEVNWPATHDGVLLKLVLVGRVVRAEGTCAAMSTESYQFKTRRSGLELPRFIGASAGAG